ncbi:MAG TPA: endo-1,4-beta-xylanase [Polyangiaceae bacterium]|nr:endo-1,4-beta-xylanase [Polyangiaceae bacterium]
MNRRYTMSDKMSSSVGLSGSAGLWLLAGAVFSLSGCATAASGDESDTVASSSEAITAPSTPMPTDGSCGFQVTSDYVSRRHGQGYFGALSVKNVSGPKARSFEIFADLGGATIKRRCLLADCEAVEGGYSFTEPVFVRMAGLKQGHTLPIMYGSPDPYSTVTPYVISVNDIKCDPIPPQISLSASKTLVTASGTLQLTALASDNIAVRKVVFKRDGVDIGVDTTAPFSLDVAADASLNGRNVYTAVAYDPSGNTATSNAARVLTGIGNKYFGTAATTAVDYPTLRNYFNQITPGNAGKWGSVEATRNQMNWTDLDTAYQFAKQHGLPFKLHTLVWGQQQPSWLASLTPAEQLAEVEQWISLAAARYPDVQMIDVVNEPLHAVPGYSAALGGPGVTGWDWVIKSFELARKYFPKSELHLNDYNVEAIDSAATDYIKIINLLKERGLIDGIGLQAHFLERAETSVVAANLDRFAATGLPIYISELDLNMSNDARQAQHMRDLFTLFWQHPSVLGVTHWGFLQGNMWQADAYLVRTDGTRRPALDWINCFRAGGTNCPVPEYIPTPRTGDSSSIVLQAEDYDTMHGIVAAGDVIAYVENGDWESFSRVVFDKNWDNLSVTYANGGSTATTVTLREGSLTGPVLATVQLPPTGGWNTISTISVPFMPVSGERNVFVAFGGGVNLDKITFSAPAGVGPNLIANNEFEQNTNGWFTWNGTLSVSNQYAVTGAQSLRSTNRNGNGPIATSLNGLVLPGKSYEVSMWTTVTGAAANVNVTQAVNCAGQTAYTWLINPVAVQVGQWTKLSGTLAVPDCVLNDVQIFAEGPNGGDLYLDHVSVRAKQASNIVSNGTFESGTSGWSTYSGVASSTTARAHSGSRSLLIGNRTGNAPAITNLTQVVTKGASYSTSFWVSIGGAASANVNLTQKVTCDGVTSYSWFVNPVTVNDGQWVELKGTLNIPNCANLSEVSIFAEGPGAGIDMYVDDVNVFIPTITNLLSDGTFESSQGSWFTWGTGTLAVTSARAHGGTKSLLFSNRVNNGPIARSLMGIVQPGKSYQVSMWTSIGGAASANVNMTRALGCDGVDSYAWLVNPVTVADGAWVKMTGTLSVPNCNLTNALVYLEGPGTGIDIYVDDAVVTQ